MRGAEAEGPAQHHPQRPRRDAARAAGARTRTRRGAAGETPHSTSPPREVVVMTACERLPDKRVSLSINFELDGLKYTATVSRYADGRIGELLLNNHKSNSQADTNARDSAIVFSFAVQHGADPHAIRKAL